MQVFCCATDHAKIILSSLLNLLQTFFSLSLNKDETLYSTPKHTQSEKYLSEQVRIIISVFSGANVSLTRGRGGVPTRIPEKPLDIYTAQLKTNKYLQTVELKTKKRSSLNNGNRINQTLLYSITIDL